MQDRKVGFVDAVHVAGDHGEAASRPRPAVDTQTKIYTFFTKITLIYTAFLVMLL
jgi:hypothetical protein